MTNDPVRLVPVNTHPVVKNMPRSVVAVVPSSNVLPADQTDLVTVPDFATALKVVNHQVAFSITLIDGETKEVRHTISEPEELEADATVDSQSIPKAGMLASIPETREMLISKAFLSELSNRLKNPNIRTGLQQLLADKEIIKKLRSKAAELNY